MARSAKRRVGQFKSSQAGGALTVRGTSNANFHRLRSTWRKDVDIGAGATLTFAGATTLNAQTSGSVVVDGGAFVLDNTTTNNTDRLRDGSSGSTGLETIGGGSFTLRGNTAGSSETLGRLQLGASNERSGALTITVQHNAGSSAPDYRAQFLPILLEARSGSGTSIPLDTVNFAAADGSGNALPLGLAGNNPRITFNTIHRLDLPGAAGQRAARRKYRRVSMPRPSAGPPSTVRTLPPTILPTALSL